MIRPKNSFMARRRKAIPQRAIDLLERDGATPRSIAILEEHDRIERVLPELGPTGLLDVIDSEDQSYQTITAFTEKDRRFFEMTVNLTKGGTLYLIIPDAPWLDDRLRLVIETELS